MIIAQCPITAWHHGVTALPFVTHLPVTTMLVSIGVTMDMIQMVAGWVLIVQQNALILRACIPKYPLLEEVDPISILSSRLFYFV